jgi:hypothetical protein
VGVWSFTALYGPERCDTKSSHRQFYDLVRKLADGGHELGINAEWAQEGRDALGGGGARWYGVALYGVQPLGQRVSRRAGSRSPTPTAPAPAFRRS